MNLKTNQEFQPEDHSTETSGLEDDRLEIEERDMKFWSDADVIVPGGKTRMILYIDTDVYEWFTEQDGDHHILINDVLRRYMNYQQMDQPKAK